MQKTVASGSSSALEDEKPDPGNDKTGEAFALLEQGVYAALETYSNVHRGSGHNSMVSTHLYEQAREIVLEYLGLNKGKYVVIFCTPLRAEDLRAQLKHESYQSVSSRDIGLSMGVSALAIDRKALPEGTPFQTGGGTTRLVSPGWVVWAGAPDKFEAGTPAIVNVIAFARALQLTGHFGHDAFRNVTNEKLTAGEILYNDELKEYHGQELLNKLRKTLIGQGLQVPTMEGAKPYINLDNGASTPTFSPVWKAVCQTWHQAEKIREEIIHEVRSITARMLGAPIAEFDVIFTSNTTEAINLTAESMRSESVAGIEAVVLNTLLEHNSNDLPWRMVPNLSLIRLRVDTEGFVDLNELDTLMYAYNRKGQYGKKRISLVAVSGASNVLGVFNDLEEISRIVHLYGARLLVDAAQLVAHRRIGMDQSGIDYLAFSAHKVYAPFGTGVLVARKGLLNFSSARMEQIKSSGEENAGGIAALGKSMVLLQRIGLDKIQEEEQALTARALSGLSQIPGLSIYGIKDPESPGFARKGGVIAFSLKNMMSDRLAKELAVQRGIGIRYGCHCAHLLVKHILNVPHFLQRLQRLIAILFPGIIFPGVARMSLGIGNSEEDVDTLIQVVSRIARQHRTQMSKDTPPANQEKAMLSRKDVQQQISDFIRAAARRVYSI